MKTQVAFRSSKFPPYDGEEAEINPECWGKRLAEYLAAKLAEKGVATDEMAVEDWGCYLPIQNCGFRLALCCGHQKGHHEQFLVFTDPSTPRFRKWFRTIDAKPQFCRLLGALREILEADPEIQDIEWKEDAG